MTVPDSTTKVDLPSVDLVTVPGPPRGDDDVDVWLDNGAIVEANVGLYDNGGGYIQAVVRQIPASFRRPWHETTISFDMRGIKSRKWKNPGFLMLSWTNEDYWATVGDGTYTYLMTSDFADRSEDERNALVALRHLVALNAEEAVAKQKVAKVAMREWMKQTIEEQAQIAREREMA